VRQYVILGAGLDTFAYRQPAWASDLRIVEVDQPASQETKREMLERAGIAIPPNVGFGAADFEHETLADGLARAGLDRGAPAFFSWLGVTMYLTREAIEAVLRTVAEFPARSELVLTFAHSPAPGEPIEHPLAIRAAAVGEPWVSYFTPDALSQLLRATGFSEVEFLSVDAAARYFGKATLSPPRRVSIATAIV
jgi:methyltransferase (TIGR00027 family)